MNVNTTERRRSIRRPCADEIVMLFVDESPGEMAGLLHDVSAEGFRATHHWLALSAGRKVRFKHSYDEGLATVMWTKVWGQKAESGFLVDGGKE
jgi:hypothetical protein